MTQVTNPHSFLNAINLASVAAELGKAGLTSEARDFAAKAKDLLEHGTQAAPEKTEGDKTPI